MKLRTKAVAYGAAGLVLAGAVIVSGSTLGFLNASSFGVLSVLLTDPPAVPNGVTAVYITYSSMALQANGFGDAGWVTIPGSGTIDTMKLVNLSQTISSVVVPSRIYNLIALNISGASVEFDGKNYSATVSSGKVDVPFVGGLNVNSSRPAAALIDIQPTVLNLGTRSGPVFTLAAGAKALQVPSDDVSDSLKHVGQTYRLQGHGWFDSFRAEHSDRVDVSVAALTTGSLSFSVTNSGSDPVRLRMVVLTASSGGSSESGGAEEGDALGSVSSGTVFAVEPDGSLMPFRGPPGQVDSLFGDSGFTLAPGATQQFSYTGTISGMMGGRGVVSGTSYFVVLIGSEVLGGQTIVAS